MDELLVAGRVVLSLACVVGLVWYLARRFGSAHAVDTSREPEVRVVTRQGLGRHAGVAVVAVGTRRLLVGFGEQNVTMLTELGPVLDLPTPPRVPSPRPAAEDAVGPADALVPVPGGDAPGPAVTAGALAGSLLSPQTWRATVRALQDRTVRR